MTLRKKKTKNLHSTRIKSEPFPDVPLNYVHYANFAARKDEAILTFMQVVPPVSENTSFEVQARCVSRIIFSIDNFEEFVEDLNNFSNSMEEKTEEDEIDNENE